MLYWLNEEGDSNKSLSGYKSGDTLELNFQLLKDDLGYGVYMIPLVCLFDVS